MNQQEPVYLIDGSAYIYRAYHAIAPLTNKSGLPTHAVYGFTNILLRVLREKAPRFLGIAFDVRGPNFRHEMYQAYKANRPTMPDDLACQIPYIKEIVAAHNIACLERQGYEADDLLASAAKKLAGQGHPVIVVSGDKDLLQLVSESITVWDPMRDVFMDPAAVRKKYNLGPEQLLDFFALMGDSSDNVPGVAGIGPKTAEKLITQCGSLDGIYQNLETISQAKLREKLLADRENAFLSRKLITLIEDLATPELQEYEIPEPNEEKLQELYTFLDFSRLVKAPQTTAVALETKGFHLVQTEKALQDICQQLSKGPVLVLDTETTSLDPLVAELVGISLCSTAEEAYYLPIGHRDSEGNLLANQLPLALAREHLTPLFSDPNLPKLGHNLKFDLPILESHGLPLSGPLWDTMLASYLLDPSRRSQKLDDLCLEMLGKRLTSFAEVTEGDKRPDSFAYVAPEAAKNYSCEDVIGAFLLWQRFHPQLEEFGLWKLFSSLEMALVPILVRMEQTGITVDQAQLQRLSEDFGLQLAELEKTIYALAGEEFNINSTRQLGEILFAKLGLPQGRKTKTGYSTDVKVLESLARQHDLPAAILAHRTLSKLKNTYVDKLPELIHPKTGRIHTSFNQTVTATGRLSSSNPNLQNIPIRTPEGQKIRAAFVAAPGQLFLSADYSQIDLRVMAHYAQDPALLTAFRAGEDVHNQTAAEIFRVNPAFISPEMRRVAKTINFGIIYGISAFGLAAQLNLSRKEAATFIERYFAHYAGVKRFMEEIVEKARKDGFVTTLLNRRRLLPDINSSNKASREFAERTAINTPIQGTAADIIKLATIAATQHLTEKGLHAKLLLQIHDELVFEVPAAEIEATGAVVKEAMEGVMQLDVPLVVNTVVGENLAKV
ncbi:DNA polymerase I [Thiovibrio frasassiensis]|uniref:DNA polymerase I n=1 Tax=Thiovibrio frasassiensis TaxID=2984131 RepID=A0A9X4MEM5_9BACT|nr:DNA polymerase I [Thiovibrio frasassiensis]MDG4475831.1 DNA polymerase I [Thiovibrio frasassiensis]